MGLLVTMICVAVVLVVVASRYPGEWRVWGAPRTGEGGSVSSMIRAGRFEDASRIVDDLGPIDRAALALARLGPLDDLLPLARSRHESEARTRARGILGLMAPRVGYGRPSSPIRQPIGDYARAMRDQASRHHYARAGQGFGRLARKFPLADDVPSWLLGGALAHAAARHVETARRRALQAAGQLRDAEASEAASRLLRILESAPEPEAVRVSRRARRRMRLSAAQKRAGGSTRIAWPAQIQAMCLEPKEAVDLTDLTLEGIVAVLSAGAEVYVGQLDGDNSLAVLVRGASLPQRWVTLGDGSMLLWDDLVRRSTWGQHMVVCRAARAEPTWAVVALNDVTGGPPIDDSGRLRDAGADLAAFRHLADAHPDEATLAFGFIRALAVAASAGDSEVDVGELQMRSALALARFPTYLWPRVMWGVIAWSHGESDNERVLGGLAELAGPTRSVTLERALAEALPDERLHHLREAGAMSPLALGVLGDALRAAIDDGRVEDFGAAMTILEAVAPGDRGLPEFRRIGEVMRLGERGAFDVIPDVGPQSHALGRAALASHAAEPDLLKLASERLREDEAYRDAGAVAQIIVALHAGDGEEALRSIEAVTAAHGLGPVSSRALVDVIAHVWDPAAAAEPTRRCDPFVVSQPGHVAVIARALHKTRARPHGLSLARALVAGGSSPIDAEYWLIDLLIKSLPDASGAAQAQLVSEGLATMDRIAGPENEAPVRALALAALQRFDDADRAWATLTSARLNAAPYFALWLAADISGRRGDERAAGLYRARLANPEVLAHAIEGSFGIVPDEVMSVAVATLDPERHPRVVYGCFAAGADVARLPSAGRRTGLVVSDHLLERLACGGHWEHLDSLLPQRYTATALLEFVDGAAGFALRCLAAAARGDVTQLEAARARSRHPEVLRAAVIAERFGLGADGAMRDAQRWAPGLVADLTAAGVVA